MTDAELQELINDLGPLADDDDVVAAVLANARKKVTHLNRDDVLRLLVVNLSDARRNTCKAYESHMLRCHGVLAFGGSDPYADEFERAWESFLRQVPDSAKIADPEPSEVVPRGFVTLQDIEAHLRSNGVEFKSLRLEGSKVVVERELVPISPPWFLLSKVPR